MEFGFLLGAHKSGTSLLRSLLDDLSIESVALPIETHPFVTLHLDDPTISLEERIKSANDWIVLNNRQQDSGYGGNYGFNCFDEESFFQSCNDWDLVDGVDSLISQYLISINQSLKVISDDTKLIIEKSIDNHNYVGRIKEAIPQAKFIHILRNPYSNLTSLRNYYQKIGRRCDLIKALFKIESSYLAAGKYSKIYPEDYLVIDYEDLLKSPRQIVEQSAKHFGIHIDGEIQLYPTVLGREWGGNSTSGDSYSSVNKDNLLRWLNDLKAIEVALINSKFESFEEYFSIDNKLHSQILKVIVPAHFESIRTYFKHRIFLMG